MNTRAILLIALFLARVGQAQENIPVGTWRSHFNYERTHLVESVNGQIYCANQYGLFFFDPTDNSLNKLSKINGLSDIRVSAMTYDSASDILALGYENGNIDIISDGLITNITKIKNRDISDSKRINHITFSNGLVYISTNFGIIVLEPSSGEVKEAYLNLGPEGEPTKINGVAFNGDKIYAATNSGVLEGTIASNINLQDFNNWERFEGSEVYDTRIVSVALIGGDVLATDGDFIFSFDGTGWSDTGYSSGSQEIIKLKNQGAVVLVVVDGGILSVDPSGAVVDFNIEAGSVPKDAVVTNGDILWYADFNQGLTQWTNQTATRLVPNGIFEGPVAKLQLAEGRILALPFSMTSLYQPLNNGLGYAQFEQGSWQVFSTDDLLGLDDISAITPDLGLVASFGDGILRTQDQLVFDETNSPLTKTGFSGDEILVSGLAQDNDGNTWVSNAGKTPLLKLDSEGNWESFSFGISASERPIGVKISNLGNVWLPLSSTFSGGILAYDPLTDERRYISSSDGLPSSRVTDLEFAKDDEIWIGTDEGLAFFPFSFGVIADPSIRASKPVFENNFLLDGEYISAIEIDGGNRKWVGTKDGLWLFEDRADKVVHQFNVDNSPLLSNNILDLKIHPVSGELFIATDMGLVSFRSDASEGTAFHQKVKIFPNPVVSGFNGLVGISGLASDAIVKITNVSGRLVRELHAAGGSTSWDVADYNGMRAQSGVYLVFSSSEDGKETFVGKIAVIN